jgi:hypothetical protein
VDDGGTGRRQGRPAGAAAGEPLALPVSALILAPFVVSHPCVCVRVQDMDIKQVLSSLMSGNSDDRDERRLLGERQGWVGRRFCNLRTRSSAHSLCAVACLLCPHRRFAVMSLVMNYFGNRAPANANQAAATSGLSSFF